MILGVYGASGLGTEYENLAEVINEQENRWESIVFVDDDPNNTKYICDILTSAEAVVQSPVVKGTSVTFAYKAPSASSVKLAGSFNNWAQVSMAKNAYGIWTTTVNNIAPGIHTYKFIANNDWVTDPVNPWIMADSDNNENSAFIVLDPNAVDTNEITVKIHYARTDGNYSGWNTWMWGLTFPSGQYDLKNEDGHMTATVKVPGRSTQSISYIIRHSTTANAWHNQEYGERRVDLSDIVSGTVHCYVNSGEYSTVRVLDTDVIQKNKISSVKFNKILYFLKAPNRLLNSW